MVSIGEPIRYLLRVKDIDWQGSNGPLGTKKCNFDIWDKKRFFVLESGFFVKRAYHQYNWVSPQKNIHPEKNFRGRTVVNQTWWDRPGHQKNDPHRQRTCSRPVLWRKVRFNVLPKSRNGPKIRFPKKNTQNPQKD